MSGAFLPIGCFGKLPFWREYLEHRASMPTSRAFRRWLHDGNEQVSLHGFEDYSEPGAEQAATPPEAAVQDRDLKFRLWFLTSAGSSSELLVGVLRPSGDAGGRHFPFATFTHVSRKTYGKHSPLLPIGLHRVWETLDDAWQSLHEAVSRDAFEEMLDELEIPAPEPTSQIRGIYKARQRQSAGALIDRGDGASFAHLSGNVAGLAAALRDRGPRGTTVELPVSADLEEACFDVSLWIDLVNRQFLLKRFEPQVFLDSSPGIQDRRAILHFGALTPEDFPGILGLSGTMGGFLRPAHPAEQAAESIDPSLAGEPGTMTYAEVLQHRYR